jgi:hypothetical protein
MKMHPDVVLLLANCVVSIASGSRIRRPPLVVDEPLERQHLHFVRSWVQRAIDMRALGALCF